MFLFLGLVKKCQKKEREISVERLHSMRIGCLMKDSSYGFKSQKVNKAICKLCNYAVIDIVVMGGQCPCIPCKRHKAPG